MQSLMEGGKHEEDVLKYLGGTLFGAGSDTTVSSIHSFMLAMVLYPEVQKKAQAEIDRVIGNRRLPVFEDRDQLPYIECILKETHRWLPVAPLALPHLSMEEDEYEGYYIPKHSIVFGNIWAISRDESMYPDPERFWPERYANPDKEVLDPRSFVFGYGRRACPGLHYADSAMFMAIVSILAMFDLSRAHDEYGNVIEPDQIIRTGIFNHFAPFKCSIKPRSAAAAELVRTAAAAALAGTRKSD